LRAAYVHGTTDARLSRTEAERGRRGAMTAGELRQRYQEIGGDEARSRSREELIRRIPAD